MFLYCAVVALTAWRHEPWADEAQAWLLARDASFFELWTKLLHYEGSPGVWHTLLMILNRTGMPYRTEGVASGLLGLASAGLIFWKAPFPFVVRLLLPFTYFLAFQYAVVARSYSLLPALLFGATLLYRRAEKHFLLFFALLGSMACVSVHGLFLSAALLSSLNLDLARRWKEHVGSTKRSIVLASAAYIALVAVLAAFTWPANDVAFPAHAHLSWESLGKSTVMFLEQGFTGNRYLTLLAIGISLPFLYRGGGLTLFALSFISLIGFGGIVYSQVWHTGTLFLSWLAAMWLSASNSKLPRPSLAALVLVIGIQCEWTVESCLYDWNHPYSGSKEAANYLKAARIAPQPILAFGYSCTALQPYFERNIFANYAPGKAYWDWSTGNSVNDPGLLFSTEGPEYAIVGYKAASDMEWLIGPLQQSGFSKVKHFAGSLFWRTAPFEAEDFDLYRRTKLPTPVALTYLSMADPASSRQLLGGFYSLEVNSWRWTSREFTVLLKTPPPQHGMALIELHLFVPPDQIKKLGPLTLSATVNGFGLKRETFSAPGTYIYTRSVPSSALTQGNVFAKFSLDKALPPWRSDGRELGAIVTAVGLKI